MKRTIKLNNFADLIDVHPRTVLRALYGKTNVYWAEGHNPDLIYADINTAFNLNTKVVDGLVQKKDRALAIRDAAKLVNTRVRVFRYRNFPKMIKVRGVVRYSANGVIDYHLSNYED